MIDIWRFFSSHTGVDTHQVEEEEDKVDEEGCELFLALIFNEHTLAFSLKTKTKEVFGAS